MLISLRVKRDLAKEFARPCSKEFVWNHAKEFAQPRSKVDLIWEPHKIKNCLRNENLQKNQLQDVNR
jgi:hypothetical protein